MIVKTKAILLHHIRHSDNSLIAYFYTEEYGRLTIMVKGLSSKKGNNRYLYFQPLFLFDLELYYRDTRDMQNLKDLNLSYTPVNIPTDISKSTISLFTAEVLYATIREEDVNRRLYSFIESSVKALDGLDRGVSNFHIWFLVNLSSYLGIGPTSTNDTGRYFDMLNGQFVREIPFHPDYLEPRSADWLNRLLQYNVDDLPSLNLSGVERSLFLDQIIRYYTLHLPGMRHIRSLRVLNEIFR
jgi:DNA repair protein RecO (recombination protein O)